jgi:hypothetical protein
MSATTHQSAPVRGSEAVSAWGAVVAAGAGTADGALPEVGAGALLPVSLSAGDCGSGFGTSSLYSLPPVGSSCAQATGAATRARQAIAGTRECLNASPISLS